MGWGMTLLGLLAMAAGGPLARVSSVGGSATAVAVVGQTAWVSAGAQLLAYDIADAAKPRATGARLPLPGIALHLAARGNVVFAACEHAGLVAADVSNPASPRLVGQVDLVRSWAGLVVDDKWLYALAAEDGLHTFDAADPAHPAAAGKAHTPSIGRALSVVGGYARVLDLEGGLGIYDTADPTDPRRLTYCDLPQDGLALAMRGTRLLAICESQTLQVFDVDDPGGVKRIGLLHLDAMPRTLTVKDDAAYIGTDRGLMVIDVSDATSPQPVRTLPRPALAAAATVDGDRLVVADNDGGLRLLTLADPLAPAEGGCAEVGLGSVAVAASGSVAWSLADDGTLTSVELRDPAHPAVLGRLRLGGRPRHLAVEGPLLLATGDDGLLAVDVSQPAQPRQVGRLAWTMAGRVALHGRLALVAAGRRGAEVVDVSNPALPKHASWHQCLSVVQDVAWGPAGNGYLLGEKQHYLLDLKQPEKPREVGGFGTWGRALAMAVSDGLLVAASKYRGLECFALRPGDKPMLLSELELTETVRALATDGHRVYAATKESGLLVVDLRDPQYPRRLGAVQGWLAPVAVALGPGWLAAAEGPAGLTVWSVPAGG